MDLENQKNWYAVYTKAKSEKKVTERLLDTGIEAYCPTYTTIKQWSDRKKKIEVPLITSYIFVKIEESNRNIVLLDPGVVNFVFWLGKPAILKDSEINSLKAELVDFHIPNVNIGESLIIEQGTFKGVDGTVISKTKKYTSIYLTSIGMTLKLSNSAEVN